MKQYVACNIYIFHLKLECMPSLLVSCSFRNVWYKKKMAGSNFENFSFLLGDVKIQLSEYSGIFFL